MKIVRIIGGIGNQMFQYALAVSLKHKFSAHEVLIDPGTSKTYKLHNGYELDSVFNITIPEASPKQIGKLTFYTSNYKLKQLMGKFLPKRKTELTQMFFYRLYPEYLNDKNGYYDGYWQCEDYFEGCEELLKQEFSFKQPLDNKNKSLFNQIFKDKDSVSIHIRRGDYLTHPKYSGLCGIEYYTRAITYLSEKSGALHNFYIFSNDIPWCEENIRPLLKSSKVVFVDWNQGTHSWKDMQLMSTCKTNIIANSSFSWWAAYLNEQKNKTVIAPKIWINYPMEYQIQKKEWILL